MCVRGPSVDHGPKAEWRWGVGINSVHVPLSHVAGGQPGSVVLSRIHDSRTRVYRQSDIRVLGVPLFTEVSLFA